MREIKITSSRPAVVDVEDYERITADTWNVNKEGYAMRRITLGHRHYYMEGMHRTVMGLHPGDKRNVDHINGDTLDNRKCNLRVCSPAENSRHQRMRCDNTSGFKGVSKNKGGTSWYARIKLNGIRHHLGSFATSDEAAHAYNKAAIAMHGEFAVLNPIGASKEGENNG
jgi:hypothetical protein